MAFSSIINKPNLNGWNRCFGFILIRAGKPLAIIDSTIFFLVILNKRLGWHYKLYAICQFKDLERDVILNILRKLQILIKNTLNKII